MSIKVSLQDKYGHILGKPRKREKLTKHDKAFLRENSLRLKYAIKMGKFFMRHETRRFGV